MSRLVEWDGRLIPRALIEPDLNPPPGTCSRCGGLGSIPEQLDDDRLPVMVPCYRCREFCKTCRKWLRKGHTCPKDNQ
jgi:hypothetical protein